MRHAGKRFFLVLALIVGAVLILPPLLLHQFMGRREFKSLAEESVSQVLRAKVQIHQMNLSSYNEINVSGLEIQSPKNKGSYQIRVQKILFRFNPLEMILRNKNRPSEIIFNAPQLVVRGGELPYDFLNSLSLQANESNLSSFSFQGGEIEWMLPYLQSKVIATGMKGKLKIVSFKKVKVFFETQFTGAIQGKVKIKGTINPRDHTHDLAIEFDEASFSDETRLPFKAMQGRARWRNHNIFLDSIETKVQGWNTVLSGSLENYHDKPQLFLNWRLKDGPAMRLELNSSGGFFDSRLYKDNLLQHMMQGVASREGIRFELNELVLNRVFLGTGLFDFVKGEFFLDFHHKNEPQRFRVALDYEKSLIDIALDLDHLKLFDLDWIVHGNIKLEPVFYAGQPKLSSLRGHFSSGSVLIEYMPLKDFKGEFLLTEAGLESFEASWGDHFHASGDVTLSHHDWEGDVAVEIKDFDMEKLVEFAGRPIRHRVGGILDGKLKIKGNLRKPECLGQFTVRDGKTDTLTYDRAYIQFSGIPPMLALYDSKAFKGRARFDLTGTVDLSLPNILKGVLIQTPDRWVAWKGSDYDPRLGDEPMLKKKSSSLPGLAFKIKAGAGDQSSEDANKKEEKDERFFGIGPKFKF